MSIGHMSKRSGGADSFELPNKSSPCMLFKSISHSYPKYSFYKQNKLSIVKIRINGIEEK